MWGSREEAGVVEVLEREERQLEEVQRLLERRLGWRSEPSASAGPPSRA